MPASSSPPKGGLVTITSKRFFSPISFSGFFKALSRRMFGFSMPCSSRFIVPSRYGSGFFSTPNNVSLCSLILILGVFRLRLEILIGLD